MEYLLTRKPGNIFNEMEDMMNSVLGTSACTKGYPAVDIREEKESYILEAEVPGINEDNIEIKLDDNLLTINAKSSANTEKMENKDETEAAKRDEHPKTKYLLRERRALNFTRSFVLPKDADRENITASVKSGLLKLTINKTPKKEPRSIKINTI